MDNLEIKFKEPFCKLHGQKMAKLIYIRDFINNSELNDYFIKYDTKYYSKSDIKFNKLKEENYVLLVFLGNKNIPFTTLRKNTKDNLKFYHDNINKYFYIKVVK